MLCHFAVVAIFIPKQSHLSFHYFLRHDNEFLLRNNYLNFFSYLSVFKICCISRSNISYFSDCRELDYS